MLANEVISTLENPVWFTDQYQIHNLKIQLQDHALGVHAFITPRPSYCDRGHFMLNVDGPFGFDEADRFPRYFMDLERAKKETEEFLRWRVHCMLGKVK